MRTTLDIDADVLQAAKERARRDRTTIGMAVSELARRGLTAVPDQRRVAEPNALYGLEPFEPRGGVVTNDLIDRLRDDDIY